MSKIIGITAATPAKPGTGGGTGSGLPEVTAKDNGKVLKVKNGAWGVGVDEDTEQIQTDYEQNNASKPDYIKNRPFYELPAPMDVSWDGDWESAFGTAVEDQGGWWHKVSDQTPEPSAFIGGTVTYAKGLATKSATIPENGVLDAREIGGYAAISGYDGAWVGGIMVVYDDTKFDGNYSAGIYFRYDDAQNHTLGVTFEGAEAFIKKIDKKFLPDDIGTNIKTFNSVEEMNAANLPDNTIACVPSSGESGGGGGGGLPVVVLTTPIEKGKEATLSAEESAALSAAFASNTSVVIHLNVEGVDLALAFARYSIPDAIAAYLGYTNLAGDALSYTALDPGDGNWVFMAMSASGGGSAPSGGGLPVVVLTTVATEEGAPLTKEENDLMDDVAAKNMPFVLKANDGITYATGVANGMGMTPDSPEGYSVQVYDSLWMVMNTGDGWALMIMNI